MVTTPLPALGSTAWFPWASDIDKAVSLADVKYTPRLMVGGHVDGVSTAPNTGSAQFDPTYTLESEMKATFDIVSHYRAIGSTSASEWNTAVLPELVRNPNRRVQYVAETWRSNQDFISEINGQTGIYADLVATLTAIRDGGHMDRVALAPFHEGNGPGSTYPWQMYDTSRGNTPELYKQAFKKFVDLARSLGVTCKIIQWWLSSNTASAAQNQNFTEGFVGDDYADILGVSYYNRSGAVGYGATWTPTGAEIRTWYRQMEQMSSRPMWICETGCAYSNNGFDKGLWYADLIRLCSSAELPRIRAMVMFMRNVASTDMSLENTDQKRLVGRAINESRRTTRFTPPATFALNLMPPESALASLSAWTFVGTDLVTEVLAPNSLGGKTKTIRLTKPASVGGEPGSDYAMYRTVQSAFSDYVVNQPFTLTFKARAQYAGLKLSAGIRAPGGTAVFSGDPSIPLSTIWQEYTVQVGTATADQGSWRLPYFRFGENAGAGWIEIAVDMKLAPGIYATPTAEKILAPKVRDATDAATILWDCEHGDLWKATLAGNRVLSVPTGTPYDGQEISFRATQDATGNRGLTLAAGYRTSTVPLTIGTTAWTTTLLTFQYDARQLKWGLVRCITWGA